MPTIYEARCLNCGCHGHYKCDCPKTECRKCHGHGHCGSQCHVKLPSIKFDGVTIDDKLKKVKEDETELGEDHLEKYYAS